MILYVTTGISLSMDQVYFLPADKTKTKFCRVNVLISV